LHVVSDDEEFEGRRNAELTTDYSATSRSSSVADYDEKSVGSRSCDSIFCDSHFEDLPLEFWNRSDECKDAKSDHMDRIDSLGVSRELLVLYTTLADKDIALEENMFPYCMPEGVRHFTLWSRKELVHHEIVSFVDDWLVRNYPHVKRWQYDDNAGDRSVDLFHVHVYIEVQPYSFQPSPDRIYTPPHIIVPDLPPHLDKGLEVVMDSQPICAA